MHKVFTLLFLLVIATGAANAQAKSSGTLRGKLSDTTSRQSLKDATISLLDPKDSTLTLYALTKADGTFLIENIPFDSYLLMASFQGYREKYKTVSLSKTNADIDLGSMLLETAPAELAGVTVKTAPVVIKGDTSEFNAGQFKTKPNATAEDILKKMPGMEVAKDGTVKAQGQDVKRVLVDGKRFFGDDPKLATRNLPTDMIDKIQVYDAQSDQSAFSGFDDGNREKTINIITKKDRRKGYFGKGVVGGGTEGRYATNVNLSHFNGNQQISFIGQANNTNQQNFSIQDILGVMSSNTGGGGGGRGGGGMQVRSAGAGSFGGVGNFLGGSQSGIARTIAGGLNYNDVWGPKTSVNGSYFYNNMRVTNDQDRLRETFVVDPLTHIEDSSLFNNNRTSSDNRNQNHRFNFEIEQKFDSMNSIQFRPSFSYQESDNHSESTSFTTKGKTVNRNDVRTINNSTNDGYNMNNNLLYRHKFAKRGRTFSLNFSQGSNNSSTERNTLSYNTFYNNGTAIRDTTNQVSNIERDGKSYGVNASYTEPLDIKSQMEVNYNYNNSLNNSDQKTMSFNKATQAYDKLNTLLSNNFENTNNSHRVSVSYRRQVNKDWNYSLGMGVQHAELTSDNKTKDTYLSQSFNNFFPTLQVQYSKNRTKNLRFSYRGSTRQPSVTQLQDVIDNSNPLNITSGNPSLNQEFSNTFNLFYTDFNIFTFKNIVASINGGLTSNKIGNSYTLNTGTTSIIIDNVVVGPGAQYSKPVNLNGAYNFSGFFNYGFPVKKPKSNINLSTNLSHSKDVSLVNGIKGSTLNYSAGQTIRYTINVKEMFDMNFSSTSNYSWSKYNQQSSTANQSDNNYFTQTFSVEPTYTTKKGLSIGSDFDYILNRGQAAGYNQSIPLWNAFLAQQLFKKKQGEIRLSVNDLLNQNKSITRTVDQNYIEDVRTQVLQRYFMLSFTYNLRKFGGKQQQQNMFPGMPRGGQERMMRMMH